MILLRMEPGHTAALALTRVKATAWDHPGEHQLTILVGARRLGLGESWRYDGSEACLAALSEFGTVEGVE